MATLTPLSQLSMLEIARQTDPKGQPARVAEILTLKLEALLDAVFQEANGVFWHKCVQDASLPGGSWRLYNQGVAYEEGATVESAEVMGMLEGFSKCDRDLARKFPGGVQAYRQNKSRMFIEGMSQTLGTTLVYGNNGTSTATFTGWAPRLNTINSINVWGGGGTGSDLTSIYCVGWGIGRVSMLFPGGEKASVGIQHEDVSGSEQGMVLYDSANSYPYMGYQDHFSVHTGLCVEDPRYLMRYANIEVTGTANIFDEDILIKMLTECPSQDGLVIYCNKKILAQARIALKDKHNVNWSTRDGAGLAGVPWVWFDGVPVHRMDSITSTESAIS